MKNRTKIILIVLIITAFIGTIGKMNGYKVLGDIFLALSTLLWLYFIGALVLQVINKKQLL